MLINNSLPGELVYLEKHSRFASGRASAVNFASDLKQFVMSNIIERNKGTGTLCEGVINDRKGVREGPV